MPSHPHDDAAPPETGLASQYVDAFRESDHSGEAAAWDSVIADGLKPER